MLARHSGTSATALQSNDSRTILNTFITEKVTLKQHGNTLLRAQRWWLVLFEMMENFYKLHSYYDTWFNDFLCI